MTGMMDFINQVTPLRLDPDYKGLVLFHSPNDTQHFSIYPHKIH
jgi:hypothetical protein